MNLTPFPFWLETLSIFVGDVLATLSIGGGAYILWYVLKYPGFRVGAGWSWSGWDINGVGRLPNESDTGPIKLWPNVSIVSHDVNVRKIIVVVWVRERADIDDPGEIYGKRDLGKDGMPAEVRTTGGEALTLVGPTIDCDASRFMRIINSPIFIQTSDGEYYKAQSPGNVPSGIERIRHRVQNFARGARRRVLRVLGA
jgi:hypothetical protein